MTDLNEIEQPKREKTVDGPDRWIAIWEKKTLQSPIWEADDYLFKVYMYLYLKANWEPTKVKVGKKLVPVQRGELITSRDRIAKETCKTQNRKFIVRTRGKVDWALRTLEGYGLISRKKTPVFPSNSKNPPNHKRDHKRPKFTSYLHLTILNYKEEQEKGKASNKGTTRGTTRQPQEDYKRTTGLDNNTTSKQENKIKEKEKLKKEKEDESSESSHLESLENSNDSSSDSFPSELPTELHEYFSYDYWDDDNNSPQGRAMLFDYPLYKFKEAFDHYNEIFEGKAPIKRTAERYVLIRDRFGNKDGYQCLSSDNFVSTKQIRRAFENFKESEQYRQNNYTEEQIVQEVIGTKKNYEYWYTRHYKRHQKNKQKEQDKKAVEVLIEKGYDAPGFPTRGDEKPTGLESRTEKSQHIGDILNSTSPKPDEGK